MSTLSGATPASDRENNTVLSPFQSPTLPVAIAPTSVCARACMTAFTLTKRLMLPVMYGPFPLFAHALDHELHIYMGVNVAAVTKLFGATVSSVLASSLAIGSQ